MLRKNKKTTDIIFENGDRIESIPYEQIAENDFTLSVSTYVPEIIEREEIDPIALEDEARKRFIKKLRDELNFEKMVCELEGISMEPFIKDIKAVLEEY